MKCLGEERLESTIALISVETNQVLKIWYEGDWDILTTREMLTEEIQYYREDPSWFLEEQSGLR